MKIIVIEGTDCSGKETQTKLLRERLIKEGYSCEYFSFPAYDSPTGKIVGGPYLGKGEISSSYFKEGATNLDAKISSLYFAADRKYNINNVLSSDADFYILDRYISSNLAHQGSKLPKKEDRLKFYDFINNLEYDLLELPKADITVLLHMPYEKTSELKKNRNSLDEHEKDAKHLQLAETTYLELSDLYNWSKVSCVKDDEIRSIEEIGEDVYNIIMNKKR